MIITILSTVIVLGILVFVHEMGHFLAAKLSGIRVEKFSMGYPPRLFGKKIGDTDYCISAIPFGGYVKISGMVDESMDQKQLQEEAKPYEFRSKPWINRFLVIFSGPLMNILLAYFIFVAAVWYYGIGFPKNDPIVGELAADNPAKEAGILPGDRITQINDQSITVWDDLTKVIHNAPDTDLSVSLMRGDSAFQVNVHTISYTYTENGADKTIGLIGIAPTYVMQKVSFFKGFTYGWDRFKYLTELIVGSVGKLVAGKESIKSLAGPVTIAKIAGETAKSGIGDLVAFLALLSLNLGILNLLPIPVLDGGHLLILGMEGIVRREMPIKAKLIIQQVGMVLLLVLMLFVIYNDITRQITP